LNEAKKIEKIPKIAKKIELIIEKNQALNIKEKNI
jgi:hypothetical protein